MSEEKEIKINGTRYCIYIPDNSGILYIKTLQCFPGTSIGTSENFLIDLIQFIENKKFKAAAYLNV